MEKELNIAAILKDKPTGTKLYADAFGELSLECLKVNNVNAIYAKNNTSMLYIFYNDGKYNKYGEPILVPSKKMRDWNKFAWKQGDILVSNDGKSHVIFSRWYDDNYTRFYGKHHLNKENKDKAIYYESLTCATEKFSLEDKNASKTYINAIEEKFGGKLNFKTLKIEKTQLGFKDGDILSNSVIPNRPNGVFIFKNYDENKDLNCYVGIDDWDFVYNQHIPWCSRNEIVRYATEEEKKRLFKALVAIGKHWNAEKKVVEDIKTEYQFKPFEKVLVRDCRSEAWRAAFFSYINEYKRYVTTSIAWKYCIPYEGNESLLGTTKDVGE
jgi:hypothetical protein